METNIQIYLTEEDAKKFILFQKYFETFNFLIEKKVLDQKGATITLNFDKFGVIRSIGRADFLYIHGAEFDNNNKKVV